MIATGAIPVDMLSNLTIKKNMKYYFTVLCLPRPLSNKTVGYSL